MSDPWASLRDSVIATNTGDTFTNDLLSNPPVTPPELGARNVTGGVAFFSDSPETITSSNDSILFTDTNGLTPNTRYRLFLHHFNKSGTDIYFHIQAIYVGTNINGASMEFGPIGYGINGDVTKAGQNAVRSYLDKIPDADADINDADSVPPVNSNSIPIAQYTKVKEVVTTIYSFPSVPNNETLSAIAELKTSDSDIYVYVVVGNPLSSSYYKNDSQTAATDSHIRGTFPQRLITRIQDTPAYSISTGEETPGRFLLVTNSFEESPADTDWSGSDYTLWAKSIPNLTDGGNYGRMFYERVAISNSANYDLQAAFVANPRTPTSAFRGAVRDVGASATWLVPNPDWGNGTVPEYSGNVGTVIWKGVIPPAGEIPLNPFKKRFYYTPAGGSSAKLSLWIIPYSGS